MSRERAERLARALGVTVEVRRSSSRALWRVYLDGAETTGRYGGGGHDEAQAWGLAARALEHRAECVARGLLPLHRSADAARAAREATEAAVEAARAALEAAQARHREDSAAHLAAREALGVAHLAASPEARAAFAALTEGP